MTPRTHPPAAADEVTTLRAFLDYYRDTLRRQTEGLDARQLATALPPSDLTLGGLMVHMAIVEHSWFVDRMAGGPETPDWVPDAAFESDPDWELHAGATNATPEEQRDRFDAAVRAADRVIDEMLTTDEGLDTMSQRKRRDGSRVTLRWVLVHMIEEYARHAGHADLIRESIDGSVDL